MARSSLTYIGNQIYFKIAGHVDLDKLNMFSVYTYKAVEISFLSVRE
jgi:hypothetical protein